MKLRQSKRPRGSRAALVAVAVAAAAVAAAPASGSGADKPRSKVAIGSLGASGASGKVTSRNGGCQAHRKVSLFRLDDYLSVKIRITYTDGRGNWRMTKDLEAGEYFAKVDAAKAGSATCLYAVSSYKHF